MGPKERIILALDVSTEAEAIEIVYELKDAVGAFKIGLELFNSRGPSIFESAKKAGAERIFFDSKLLDIPNTVAGAARAAVRMGVWMFNIHASGGSAMMRAAADAASEEAKKLGTKKPLIIAVTVLTSINQEILTNELSVTKNLEDHTVNLARLAKENGLDGVVSSPHEIETIKTACGKDFLVVTPGIRPAWSTTDDQKRITTPSEALKKGTDYMVIGRAITSAPDRSEAAGKIIAEMNHT